MNWDIWFEELHIGWVDGKVLSIPPNLAEAVVIRSKKIDGYIGVTQTGPFLKADLKDPVAAFLITVDALQHYYGINFNELEYEKNGWEFPTVEEPEEEEVF